MCPIVSPISVCLYQGYVVDTAQLAFDISVNIQSNASTNNTMLHLGPTEPFSSTDDGSITVQLLGDLASYNSMPDFSSFYLMIPSPTGKLLKLHSLTVYFSLSLEVDVSCKYSTLSVRLSMHSCTLS